MRKWTFKSRPGGWVIAESSDGERRRISLAESKGVLSASVGGVQYQVRAATGRERGGGGGSDADLIAQFPGKIRKVLVQDGQSVAMGAPLVMVEAMKMEFPVKAPFAGRVLKVRVKEGQQIQPGDRFVDLEEVKS